MTLIKSISGFRGTIGGAPGDNLSPIDIVESAAAFGTWLLNNGRTARVVVGRDARPSGEMVQHLVMQTLVGLGFEVVDLGLSTTPTVEMAVSWEGAGGGIIITASHNPVNWNALKLLNERGEFISKADGQALLEVLAQGQLAFAPVEELGCIRVESGYFERHVQAILALDLVNAEAIRRRAFRVVVDPVNSTGALAIPVLLDALGCTYHMLHDTPDGQFAHNPEPLPAHLEDLCREVAAREADLGIAVDPDVDRLAFVQEDGSWFGEEYTLVAAADRVLSRVQGGAVVSNLSSSRALRDLAVERGGTYHASAVGEVNVVEKMKAVDAVIGGEGNGGVILPDLHYGRDALVGIALVLSQLAEQGLRMSALRARYADYEMVKDKIQLQKGMDVDGLLKELTEIYRQEEHSTLDGLKVDFAEGWVHLRKSNTEPIIRVYAEARSAEAAQSFVSQIKEHVRQIIA